MAEQKHNTSAALPKNIRQIGTSIGSTRVYMEDYVYTYLHTQSKEEAWSHRGFVLLGRLEREKDAARYFISGLIRLNDEFFNGDILQFDDASWAHIYQEMKQFYDELEIVGWGQDVSGASAGLTAELERNHKQNFNIQKNVMFLLDKVEQEEAFYIFEKNVMQRREGYYVYYEKNPQMQEYMIASQNDRELNISPEEIQEPLVQSYRETLLNKKEQIAARRWNGVLYATSLMLVLAVCVLGVSTVNNVEKMQNLESTVSQISGKVGQAGVSAAMSSQAKDASESSVSDADDSKKADGKDAGSAVGSSEKLNTEDLDNLDSGDTDNVGIDHSKDAAADSSFDSSEPENKGADSSGNTSADDPETASSDDELYSDSMETAALTEAQTYLLQGYYIVKKGDSLVGISKKIYGTPRKTKKICELNGIEDMDKIFVGQKLELP